jgi:hypothetical protein
VWEDVGRFVGEVSRKAKKCKRDFEFKHFVWCRRLLTVNVVLNNSNRIFDLRDFFEAMCDRAGDIENVGFGDNAIF